MFSFGEMATCFVRLLWDLQIIVLTLTYFLSFSVMIHIRVLRESILTLGVLKLRHRNMQNILFFSLEVTFSIFMFFFLCYNPCENKIIFLRVETGLSGVYRSGLISWTINQSSLTIIKPRHYCFSKRKVNGKTS